MTIKVDLKSQEVKRGFTFDFGWVIWIICVLLAVVGFLMYSQMLDNEIAKWDKEIKKNETEIAKYANIKPAIDRLRNEVNAIQGQIGQLKELRYDSLKYAVLLSNFTALLPPSIWIGNLTLEPGRNSMSFGATALAGPENPPLKSVADLIRNMQNSPYFSSVSVSNLAESKQGEKVVFTFQVEAIYKLSIADLKGSERP